MAREAYSKVDTTEIVSIEDVAYGDVDWSRAACRGKNLAWFFFTIATSSHTQRRRNVLRKRMEVPKRVFDLCFNCPVLDECARWGIHHEQFGIWGGLTDWQREEIRLCYGIRRVRPSVGGWRED